MGTKTNCWTCLLAPLKTKYTIASVSTVAFIRNTMLFEVDMDALFTGETRRMIGASHQSSTSGTTAFGNSIYSFN
ncbi:MAG: hypothetical protein JNK79_12220 [Chitinophagaceae bacterium]|nr:hypothetical protein [Chitinophagaceae bacterium]